MFKKYQTLFGQLCVFQTDFANLSSNDRSVTLGKLLFYHFDGKIWETNKKDKKGIFKFLVRW